MSTNGNGNGPGDGQVMQELRALSASVNDVKVNIARLEGGQTSMAQRMDIYERQQERLLTAVQDFDRFKQGAGVKLGAGVWVAGVAGAALVAALMAAIITSMGRQVPAPAPIQQQAPTHAAAPPHGP